VIRVSTRGVCGLRGRQQGVFNNWHYERRRQFQDEKRPPGDAERQELGCVEVSIRANNANNLLGILDDSVKRPMKITESDKNGRTIVKNQKNIDN